LTITQYGDMILSQFTKASTERIQQEKSSENWRLVQAMMELPGLSLPSREEERHFRSVELPRVSCVSA